MRLADLLSMPGLAAQECEITGLTADSRAVKPGMAFFAVPGTKADGLAFAAEAAAKGAHAIVCARKPTGLPAFIATIEVADVRRALAEAAARFFPHQPATIAAITGTSGKTSVAAFTRQIWLKAGHRAASLGTIGLVDPAGATYGSLTTPDPVTLHETLDRIARDGVTHLAMEASSHGLAQARLDGVRLTLGAFTNLSRDHLDYHASLADYLAAKLRLFDTLLRPGQTAVISADSDVAETVMAACGARGLDIVSTGRNGRTLRLIEATPDMFATRLTLEHAGTRIDLKLPLAGAFQIENALVAAGICLASGTAPDIVFAALETLEGAPGRLELVGRRADVPIFVDYAHKPDALDKVLTTLRPLAQKRLVVVFGCGGDRDAGKRPMMGEVAARLADCVIVTDDNPRSEDPALIRSAILAGARNQHADIREIGDRRSAIAQAIALVAPGDVLLIAGKGHETGQIIAGKTLPFSDHEAVRAALKDLAA